MPLTTSRFLIQCATSDQPAFAGCMDFRRRIISGYQEHTNSFVQIHPFCIGHVINHVFCNLALIIQTHPIFFPMDLVNTNCFACFIIENNSLSGFSVNCKLSACFSDQSRQRIAIQINCCIIREYCQINMIRRGSKCWFMRCQRCRHGFSMINNRVDHGIGDCPGWGRNNRMCSITNNFADIFRIRIYQARAARYIHGHEARDMCCHNSTCGSSTIRCGCHIGLYRCRIAFMFKAVIFIYRKVGLQVPRMIYSIRCDTKIDSRPKYVIVIIIVRNIDLFNLDIIGIHCPRIIRIGCCIIVHISLGISNIIYIIAVLNKFPVGYFAAFIISCAKTCLSGFISREPIRICIRPIVQGSNRVIYDFRTFCSVSSW